MALHPNAVRSPTTDFQALGVEPDDVLEILAGPNTGHYVIRLVMDKLLFLAQALPSQDAGPVGAVIRKRKTKSATLTAAIVISQPLFNNGVFQWAALDVWIV